MDSTSPENFDNAYNKSLKSLSYRPRSEKEIFAFLLKNKFDDKIISKVTAKLKDQNLLNDEEFVKWWIEQRQTHKPKSKFLIKRELIQKGVDQNLIDTLLEQSGDDYKIAQSLFGKKKKRFQPLSDQKNYQKAIQFLQRRGFSWNTIQKVLKEYK